MDVEDWADHVLSIAAERFERRLAGEISAVRIEIANLRADLRADMANLRADMLKWSLLFWVGQFAALTAAMSYMLRR